MVAVSELKKNRGYEVLRKSKTRGCKIQLDTHKGEGLDGSVTEQEGQNTFEAAYASSEDIHGSRKEKHQTARRSSNNEIEILPLISLAQKLNENYSDTTQEVGHYFLNPARTAAAVHESTVPVLQMSKNTENKVASAQSGVI